MNIFVLCEVILPVVLYGCETLSLTFKEKQITSVLKECAEIM
jgi:hypothetical protein